jgi:hypothetical protein
MISNLLRQSSPERTVRRLLWLRSVTQPKAKPRRLESSYVELLERNGERPSRSRESGSRSRTVIPRQHWS